MDNTKRICIYNTELDLERDYEFSCRLLDEEKIGHIEILRNPLSYYWITDRYTFIMYHGDDNPHKGLGGSFLVEDSEWDSDLEITLKSSDWLQDQIEIRTIEEFHKYLEKGDLRLLITDGIPCYYIKYQKDEKLFFKAILPESNMFLWSSLVRVCGIPPRFYDVQKKKILDETRLENIIDISNLPISEKQNYVSKMLLSLPTSSLEKLQIRIDQELES
jgi:hypothetical protein